MTISGEILGVPQPKSQLFPQRRLTLPGIPVHRSQVRLKLTHTQPNPLPLLLELTRTQRSPRPLKRVRTPTPRNPLPLLPEPTHTPQNPLQLLPVLIHTQQTQLNHQQRHQAPELTSSATPATLPT